MTQCAWMSTTFTRCRQPHQLAPALRLRGPRGPRTPPAKYPGAGGCGDPKRSRGFCVPWFCSPRASMTPLSLRALPPSREGRVRRRQVLSRRHRGGRRQFVADNLAALHDEFHPLKLGDVLERIAGNGREIGEFALLDRTDAVLPAQRFRVDDGSALERLAGVSRRSSPVFRNRAPASMDIGRPSAPLPTMIFMPGLSRQLNGLGENGRHLTCRPWPCCRCRPYRARCSAAA
jgi:hypothetical protein